MRRTLFSVLALMVIAYGLSTYPSSAQEDDTSVLVSRIERLERDVTYLQKQVYRGASADTDATPGAAPINGGQMEVRLSQMNEEIRQLRGQIEQIQFANRQTATDLKKLSDDTDYRLHAIEEKQNAAAVAPVPTPVPVPVTKASSAATAAAVAAAASDEPAQFDPNAKPGDTNTKPVATPAAKAALTGNDFPDSNAHYSYAFKLLNDKKYAEAASSFDAFVKKYPSDPLTSNAYYWLGESYYARADYTRAADSFRKGFEVNPDAQKAPDNLFKLAKSLEQVKRTNEACIVLTQIGKKYPDTAPRTVKRADDERLALQCK